MIKTEDWGIIPYKEAWNKQEEIFNSIITAKLNHEDYTNYIISLEHTHVYTIGRSGKDSNLLVNKDFLDRIGATLFHSDRGGDITYHGPGQLVCYPIINLEEFGLGLRDYIYILEESVIEVCDIFGIKASRIKSATGVWIGVESMRERKICAIGVRCSHFVTMHGLAFNISTDLNYFNYINPCGFTNKGVTSLQQEIGTSISVNEVTDILINKIVKNIS